MNTQHCASLSAHLHWAVAGIAILATNTFTQAIDFTEQSNFLAVGIGSKEAVTENDAVASFDEILTIQSPHPSADLTVTGDQSLQHSVRLESGSPIITLSASIQVEGSDFFDNGAGGLFSVGGMSLTNLEFTLSEPETFEIEASATAVLDDGFADLYTDVHLFQVIDQEFVPVLVVDSDAAPVLSRTITLAPGTYRVDAFGDFSALGPGEWDGFLGYGFSLTVASCVGDINGDGVVDVKDLLTMIDEWGQCSDPDACPADLNGDGVVDVLDMLALIRNWGDCGR